jgi:hypothetical protein
MFHPVGSQPPSVYWRRRFLVLATLVLLLLLVVLTVRAITSGAAGKPRAAGSNHPGRQHSTHPRVATQDSGSDSRHHSVSAMPSKSARAHHHARRHHPSPGPSSSSTSAAPPPACTPSQLAVQAVVGQPTYHVGEKPVVMLQVTNTGSAPCVQDLADKQIVLKVYNGESRVWGSHDCEVQPGTDNRVLEVGRPVRVSVTWSGLTSQPGCAGTRHRVGAGTYTLYAYLAGHEGKAAQFSIV